MPSLRQGFPKKYAFHPQKGGKGSYPPPPLPLPTLIHFGKIITLILKDLLSTFQVSGVTCKVSHGTSNSNTVRPRELNFLEKVHLLPLVTCQVSCVMCHMSCCLCLFVFFVNKAVKLVGGGSGAFSV